MRHLFLNPLLLSSLALGAALLSGCTGEVLTVEMVDLAGDAATSVPTLDASRAETASHDATHDSGHTSDVGAPEDGMADAPTRIDAGTHDGGAGDVGPQPDGGEHTDAPIPPPIDAGPGDAPADAPADHNAHDAHEAGGESDASSDGTVPVLIAIHVTIYGLPLNDSVVLQDNHTDTSTVTNSSGSTSFGFDFPTLLPTGSAYDVTAVSSSSAVTCSVVNPTGFAGSVPTTGIYVKCAPPIGTTQTVTVDLTGLAMGESVTLLLNGADDLTLTMDGTNAFTTQAAAGYVVTVKTNPLAPIAQTCTVGAMTATGVTVACTSLVDLAATQTGDVAGIASDGINVYWANFTKGTINSAPIGGAGPIATLYTGSPGPTGLAIYPAGGANYVYWTNSSTGAVMRVTAAGTNPTPLIPIPTMVGTIPTGIAVSPSGTAVYWTNRTSSGSVMSVPSGGGAATPLATGQTLPTGIATDGTSVYWTNFGDPAIATANPGVWRVTLSASNGTTAGTDGPSQVAKGVSPMGIIVLKTNLYWTDPGMQSVLTFPTAPNSPGTFTTVAGGQTGAEYIATDGANLYWTCHNTVGSVVRAPIGAYPAPFTTIVQNQSLPYFIAAYALNVYWTNDTSSGQVNQAPN